MRGRGRVAGAVDQAGGHARDGFGHRVSQTMDFKFPMALAMAKGLTFRIALCSIQSHWPELINLLRAGRLHPERFITHTLPLAEGAEAYRLFDAKENGALKMVLTP
jgi:threonine dehydrogenase-like Zn-dependent dehydrogenase